MILKQSHLELMDYAELKSYIKDFLDQSLSRMKTRMDREGPMDDALIKTIESTIEDYQNFIKSDADDYEEYMGLQIDGETTTDKLLNNIITEYGLDVSKDSDDYRIMVKVGAGHRTTFED